MKIAVVQMDVRLKDVPGNLSAMLDRLQESRRAGAELTIFPECSLTGYCFDSAKEAAPFAQTIPGPATEAFASRLRELSGYAIFGMLEPSPDGVFNAAVLVGPEGVLGLYRKIHLPYLGVDRYSTYGDRPFAVVSAGPLRVGMCICYDSAFPETVRCLALAGADLVALPTNFPHGGEGMVDFVLRTRAMENNVYFAGCNRVGTEAGFEFIGHSQIVDPIGNWLAREPSRAETILYADVDPARARNKRLVRVPEKHLIDRMADRRPEMYQPLLAPHSLQRPGRPATD